MTELRIEFDKREKEKHSRQRWHHDQSYCAESKKDEELNED